MQMRMERDKRASLVLLGEAILSLYWTATIPRQKSWFILIMLYVSNLETRSGVGKNIWWCDVRRTRAQQRGDILDFFEMMGARGSGYQENRTTLGMLAWLNICLRSSVTERTSDRIRGRRSPGIFFWRCTQNCIVCEVEFSLNRAAGRFWLLAWKAPNPSLGFSKQSLEMRFCSTHHHFIQKT